MTPALALPPPFGALHARAHEIFLGVPGTGKTWLAVERVRDARRVLFFDPAGDLEPQGRAVYAHELHGDRELARQEFCRLVVLVEDGDSAEAFRETLEACRADKPAGGLVLVADEVGDFSPECQRELTALHRNGHKDGVASILVSQCATDMPKTCRRTASRVCSLLQEDPSDLAALEERYGEEFAEQVKAWRPGAPPAVWEQRALWQRKADK